MSRSYTVEILPWIVNADSVEDAIEVAADDAAKGDFYYVKVDDVTYTVFRSKKEGYPEHIIVPHHCNVNQINSEV